LVGADTANKNLDQIFFIDNFLLNDIILLK